MLLLVKMRRISGLLRMPRLPALDRLDRQLRSLQQAVFHHHIVFHYHPEAMAHPALVVQLATHSSSETSPAPSQTISLAIVQDWAKRRGLPIPDQDLDSVLIQLARLASCAEQCWTEPAWPESAWPESAWPESSRTEPSRTESLSH